VIDSLGMRAADAANLELAGRTNGAGGATGENGSFQALLERLQQFASAPKEAPKVDDALGLQAAMRDADQSFTTAMDLRRQLEEAFRRHLS
jgi:hypothetical protein